jgi:hypothetical protein
VTTPLPQDFSALTFGDEIRQKTPAIGASTLARTDTRRFSQTGFW